MKYFYLAAVIIAGVFAHPRPTLSPEQQKSLDEAYNKLDTDAKVYADKFKAVFESAEGKSREEMKSEIDAVKASIELDANAASVKSQLDTYDEAIKSILPHKQKRHIPELTEEQRTEIGKLAESLTPEAAKKVALGMDEILDNKALSNDQRRDEIKKLMDTVNDNAEAKTALQNFHNQVRALIDGKATTPAA